MKYLKLSLPKGSLLDATILLISILLNEIVLLCWWNSYSSISVS